MVVWVWYWISQANDGTKRAWTEFDAWYNNDFTGQVVTVSFNIARSLSDSFSFFRSSQTGRNNGGKDQLSFAAWELFETLFVRSTQKFPFPCDITPCSLCLSKGRELPDAFSHESRGIQSVAAQQLQVQEFTSCDYCRTMISSLSTKNTVVNGKSVEKLDGYATCLNGRRASWSECFNRFLHHSQSEAGPYSKRSTHSIQNF